MSRHTSATWLIPEISKSRFLIGSPGVWSGAARMPMLLLLALSQVGSDSETESSFSQPMGLSDLGQPRPRLVLPKTLYHGIPAEGDVLGHQSRRTWCITGDDRLHDPVVEHVGPLAFGRTESAECPEHQRNVDRAR